AGCAAAAAAAAAAGAGADSGNTTTSSPTSGEVGGRCVRIDLVLDNSGLELFSDLCLADLLLEAGVVDQVILHGKPIPWFVSDTLEGDLRDLLASCCDERTTQDEGAGTGAPASSSCSPSSPSSSWPSSSSSSSSASWQDVRHLAVRWRSYLDSGRWQWRAHPFWCTPAPFCWMKAVAPDLYDSFANGNSDLIIFKGDLNYRKLTHDCRWPHTTPFQEALQGFRPAPLVALRTLKADVVAGLAPGLSQRLSTADPDWLVNGKWGMVQAAL
ncbi:hypothetical protein Agub_g2681, partial [Astrephomene gubernaculifera]